ncbi:MazG nucleotide pyrophosphohydrolase domain-containing protein [Thermogladius sp.]|uniref:MazG nucleotide pyrophosphohydrolase domain-containing protein n=1 Tax=Thermogladius sp. TaxID=2023064 RepID=UPI003D0B4CC2
MELREAQELIRRIYYERDHARGLYATFTWFVEEVGELARALLEMNQENLREEIADVFAWLLSVANLLNIDLEEAFKEKYIKASGS